MGLSGELRKFINGGALMSYGPDLEEAWRRVGVYTARTSRARNRLTCLYSNRPDTSWSSTSGPRGRSADYPTVLVLLADEVIE